MTKKLRNQAKQLVAEARKCLESDEMGHLRAAALSLRMAMEALTYERASNYSDDLPPDEYRNWQPRKLLMSLIEINPYADKSNSLSYGIEPSPGETPNKMMSLGTERVLDLPTVKKHYDAFGSYLHMETLQMLQAGKTHDKAKLRRKCEDIATFIEEVLASTIWNSDFHHKAEIACMECGKPVRRRFHAASGDRVVACFDCGAEYTLSATKGNKVHWEPHQAENPCPNGKCDGTIVIWQHELVQGTNWKCGTCSKKFQIGLVAMPMPDSSDVGADSKRHKKWPYWNSAIKAINKILRNV